MARDFYPERTDRRGLQKNQRALEARFLERAVDIRDVGTVPGAGDDYSVQIQYALDTWGVIYVPPGIFFASGLRTTSAVHVFGPGTIKMPADAPDDYVLRMEGDGSSVRGITIDGNKSGHLTYAGRGEGLVVAANECYFENVSVNNTFDGDNAHAFAISGNDCVFVGCSSDGAGSAAFRNNGNRNKFFGIRGTDWRRKGFLIDNNITRSDVTVGYFTSSRSESVGMECILIDPGANGAMGEAYFSNVLCSGPNSSPIANNTAKFALVDAVHLRDCQFLHTLSTLTSIRFQEGVGRVFIRDCELSKDINFDGDSEEVLIEGTIIGNGDTGSVVNTIGECRSKKLAIRDSRLYNYTGDAIRVEAVAAHFPLVTIDNVEFEAEAASATANVFSIDDAANGQGPGDIRLGNYQILVGSSDLTGVNSRNQRIQRNLGDAARQFVNGSVPTSETWEQGDIVWHSSPVSAGTIGWVCVAAGTPGTWKTWGTIS